MPGAGSHPGSVKVGLIRQLTPAVRLVLGGDIALADGNNDRLDAGRYVAFALGAFDGLVRGAFTDEKDFADFPIGLAV